MSSVQEKNAIVRQRIALAKEAYEARKANKEEAAAKKPPTQVAAAAAKKPPTQVAAAAKKPPAETATKAVPAPVHPVDRFCDECGRGILQNEECFSRRVTDSDVCVRCWKPGAFVGFTRTDPRVFLSSGSSASSPPQTPSQRGVTVEKVADPSSSRSRSEAWKEAPHPVTLFVVSGHSSTNRSAEEIHTNFRSRGIKSIFSASRDTTLASFKRLLNSHPDGDVIVIFITHGFDNSGGHSADSPALGFFVGTDSIYYAEMAKMMEDVAFYNPSRHTTFYIGACGSRRLHETQWWTERTSPRNMSFVHDVGFPENADNPEDKGGGFSLQAVVQYVSRNMTTYDMQRGQAQNTFIMKAIIASLGWLLQLSEGLVSHSALSCGIDALLIYNAGLTTYAQRMQDDPLSVIDIGCLSTLTPERFGGVLLNHVTRHISTSFTGDVYSSEQLENVMKNLKPRIVMAEVYNCKRARL